MYLIHLIFIATLTIELFVTLSKIADDRSLLSEDLL
jgi:hypothetical protein